MIEITDKNLCCACGACASVCPKNCISMVPDSEGFLYPKVDISSCIDCKLCESVCMYRREYPASRGGRLYFAARASGSEFFMNSSSGGIFPLFAADVIARGGFVFGAGFSRDFTEVSHICVDNIGDIARLQGSKYVQSRIGDCFVKCKELLKSSKNVLFSGTPCQILGLKNYLGKDFENLLTIDVACFGVPSPSVWKSYLKSCIGNLPDHCVNAVAFRKKILERGEINTFNFVISPGIVSENSYNSVFGRAFKGRLINRPCCDSCLLKNCNNVSDLTLGDCWGVEEVFPDRSVRSGISLVVVNSQRGGEALDRVLRQHCEFLKSMDEDLVLKSNKGIYSGRVVASVKRETFFREFSSPGGDSKVLELLKKNLREPLSKRVLDLVRRFLRKLRGFVLRR